ncbi:regulatory LuxR family protein [Kribbella sp. VKM Ac-2569]|uniref:ATP-binding protein n=1 Tax=Kribbella sp. VKM Ac-2569 TaxID=2512220 RepID=UPI00102CF672|nr:BREX system ATP-binding domain-containing protein [Kribbella sp. VKM Ac-2569]RZT19644.1 regulatory LuxR family protein [Kribbella sp. VKM Ac-2569]
MMPLRGRSEELGKLLEALRAASNGQASLAVVSGEPGIGKSALLAAAVEQAERQGFLVASAAAHQTDNISPLASLAPALRAGAEPLIGTDQFLELASLNTQPLWLAERLADLIGRRLAGVRALIVLDDAQWSDPLTAFVLRVVIARLPAANLLWLLATRPSPGGTTDQLIEAVDVPVRTIPLAPLTADAIQDLAADRLNHAVDPSLAVQLASVQGIPFLAEQLIAGLYLSDSDLSAGLIEGVRRRTGELSEASRDLVRTAAVFGSDFRLEDVAALMAAPVARLAAPLEEAIQAGLFTDAGSVLRFRHELLRSAALADVPPSAQRALHGAIANQLMSAGRGAAAAAPHVLAVAQPGDATAVATLREAARDLLATMSTTAAELIQEAFDLTRVDDPLRAEVGVDVVRVLLAAWQYDRARAFADDLLSGTALYHGPITPDLQATIRLHLAPYQWASQRLDAEELTAPAASPHLAERLAGYRALTGQETPSSVHDPVAQALLQVAAAERAQVDGRYVEARDLYAGARRAENGLGSLPTTLVEVGELYCRAEADELSNALERVRELMTVGDSWAGPQLAVLRARLEYAAGNLQKAEEAANSGLRWMDQLQVSGLATAADQVLALVALLRGHLTHARKLAGSDATIGALLAIADGDTKAISRLAATPQDFPERIAVLLQADALEELSRLSPSAAGRGALAVVAAGNDVEQLAAAVETVRTAQRPLLLAQAEERYGRAALEAGDRNTGVPALERVLDSLTALGATAPAGRIQAVLQAAGIRRRRWAAVPPRAQAGWESLTPMERRVALLVAEGHTNRSAAEELVVSASTVGTHLRAVFGKLGVNSRVQLTRLVLERFAAPPNT